MHHHLSHHRNGSGLPAALGERKLKRKCVDSQRPARPQAARGARTRAASGLDAGGLHDVAKRRVAVLQADVHQQLRQPPGAQRRPQGRLPAPVMQLWAVPPRCRPAPGSLAAAFTTNYGSPLRHNLRQALDAASHVMREVQAQRPQIRHWSDRQASLSHRTRRAVHAASQSLRRARAHWRVCRSSLRQTVKPGSRSSCGRHWRSASRARVLSLRRR